MFNDDQRSYMKELGTILAKDKCWCGWYRKGECYSCRRPELKDLSAQDKLDQGCKLCGNFPSFPGGPTHHIIGCTMASNDNK